MKIETIGSFLPTEKLIDVLGDFQNGSVDAPTKDEAEDEAVRQIVERQLNCGLPYITSGELRRKDWAKDFWFGLDGITAEHITSGHIYQSIETDIDVLRVTGRIGFNPDHPFFDDFRFLYDAVGGRGLCRQTLPSPANLLLEIYSLSDGRPESIYPNPETLLSDISEAYRATAMKLYEMGCASLQYDDTALGLMCDDNYTKRLLQGGVDLIKLHGEIIEVINASLRNIPADMETSIYISGGDKIVPEWEVIDYPDNIMPKALSSLRVDKFFMPFDLDDDYSLEVLRHIPKGRRVVLGLSDAHSPLTDDAEEIVALVKKAESFIDYDNLAVSPRTGFKLSSYSTRGLTYEDQWRKLAELSALKA